LTLELVTSKRRHAKERQCGWLGLARPSESRAVTRGRVQKTPAAPGGREIRKSSLGSSR